MKINISAQTKKYEDKKSIIELTKEYLILDWNANKFYGRGLFIGKKNMKMIKYILHYKYAI